MRLVESNSADADEFDPNLLRDRYHAARAEADELRFRLAETEALLDTVEAELASLTRFPYARQHEPTCLDAIVRARTETRRKLRARLLDARSREAAGKDLRMAEVAFSFLIRLGAA